MLGGAAQQCWPGSPLALNISSLTPVILPPVALSRVRKHKYWNWKAISPRDVLHIIPQVNLLPSHKYSFYCFPFCLKKVYSSHLKRFINLQNKQTFFTTHWKYLVQSDWSPADDITIFNQSQRMQSISDNLIGHQLMTSQYSTNHSAADQLIDKLYNCRILKRSKRF